MPVVIGKAKTSYTYWLSLHRDIPKTERFLLGQKINDLFLAILELSFVAAYSPVGEKAIVLNGIIKKLDILKFFIQIIWENKLVSTDRYAELSQQLAEIGGMLGAWRKSLQSKNPAERTG